MDELIYKHQQALGRNMTMEQIQANPRYKRVWTYWSALAYFKMRDHYQSLFEAPKGIKWITVMGDTCRNYKWKDGKYEFAQELTKSEVERIYGE